MNWSPHDLLWWTRFKQCAVWALAPLLAARAEPRMMDARVTASSALPLAPAFLAANADPALPWIPADFSVGNWLCFELAESVRIESLDLLWQSGLGGCGHAVELSNDGQTWREVWREAQNESITGAVVRLDPPIEASWVRIRFGARKSQGLSGLRINGADVADPSAPQPPPVPEDAPYRNPALPPEVRAADAVARMTDYEKFHMAGGYNNRWIRPVKRLGLREMFMVDASSGVRIQPRFLSAPPPGSISYPSSIALAATWNRGRARAYGRALARECRSLGADILLGPGINLYRTASCGRNFEYMGEDPVLTGTLASEYIQGMQGEGVLAVAKHFICNNHEWRRHDTDVMVDERTLHELYMLPWYYVARQGRVGAIMGSYNWLNGEKVSCSAVTLNGLLRGRIGFDGIIMSDWGAAPFSDRALGAGLDLAMAVMRDWTKFAESVTPETHPLLDAISRRILTTLFALGLYDRRAREPAIADERPDWERVALETVRDSVTLLKNNGILPLERGRVVVLGPSARRTLHAGGGSGHVAGYDHAHIAPELARALGEECVMMVDDWETVSDETLRTAETLVVCVDFKTREGVDVYPKLEAPQEALVLRSVLLNPRTVVVVCSGTGLEMDWDGRAAAVVWAYYPGQYGGRAIAEILAGRVNPSGKLPFSIEKKFSDSPAYGYIPEGASWTQAVENDIDRRLPPNPKVEYKEGVFIGYRWYDERRIDVRYPFGHGLSYTTFAYSNLVAVAKDDEILITADIRNTGLRAGTEVAQLYIGTPGASVKRPIRELKDYQRVTLEPGASGTIAFRIPPSALAFYDEIGKDWRVEPGDVQIAIGSSSRDIRLVGLINWPVALQYRHPTDTTPSREP